MLLHDKTAPFTMQQRGLSTRFLALANASWIRYCYGEDEVNVQLLELY
jgi:hypothetical protein